MVVRRLAVVSNQLEAADDLAHGEEAEDLGEQDAAAHDLGRRDVPEALESLCRGGDGRGCGGGRLQQAAGVLDGGKGAVEVALEGGDGAAGRARELMVSCLSRGLTLAAACRRGGGGASLVNQPRGVCSTYGGFIFWPRKTSLPSSRPTLL